MVKTNHKYNVEAILSINKVTELAESQPGIRRVLNIHESDAEADLQWGLGTLLDHDEYGEGKLVRIEENMETGDRKLIFEYAH